MNKQVEQIVKALIEKSRKGGVIWENMGNAIFRVTLTSGSVSISETGYIDASYNIEINGNGMDFPYSEIAGERKDGKDFNLLQKLYYTAGMESRNAKQLFKDVLKEIKNTGTIGKILTAETTKS
jgi:hypothetical protein